MEIQNMSFRTFRKHMVREEGLVFLGCGGDLTEWVDGVFDQLKEDGVIIKKANFSDVFEEAIKLTTTGGRIDLAFVFVDGLLINLPKLAIWRIRWGDCCWASDYLENYVSQHRK